MYASFIKRLCDVTVATFLCIILLPFFCLLGAAVWIQLGNPVIFRQQRPGLNGKLFTIYKFRTMKDTFDQNGKPLPDGARLTRFGAFLRRSSLDELPELFNVLRGDMSLVGPRPLFPEYLPYYTPRESRRHDLLPGITGWAQIHGRNLLPWEERLELDVWYVENQSLRLDLHILGSTFWKVIRKEGAVADNTTVETYLNIERADRRNVDFAEVPFEGCSPSDQHYA